MKNKRNKNLCSGAMLIIAVCVVTILALFGVGLLRLGRSARIQAVKDVMQMSARAAADAGIEHAVRYMIDEWNGTIDEIGWIASWDGTEIGYSFPDDAGNTFPLTGSYGNARFRYDVYKGSRPEGYEIVSVGTAGGVTRTVHAAVMLQSVFFGIGAKENININVGSTLAIIGEGEMIVQTNSTDSPPTGGIMLRQGVNVPGDVVIGPGGDTDVAIIEKKDVTIDGDTMPSDDYIDFPPVSPPSLPAAGVWPTDYLDPDDPNIAIISSDVSFDNLTVGSPYTITTLVVQGDTDIYVKGDMIVSAGASVIINADSGLEEKATFYIGESLDVKNDAEITHQIIEDRIINSQPITENDIIASAKSIAIKGTETCDLIKFFNSGDYYGTIYAPSSPVIFDNSGTFYGAVVGGDTIDIKQSTFVYIPSLFDFPDEEELYMGIKRGSWWEE